MFKEMEVVTISSNPVSLSGAHVFTATTRDGYIITNEVCYKKIDEVTNCMVTYPMSEVEKESFQENLVLFEPHWVIRPGSLFKGIEPIDSIKWYNNLSWKLIKYGYLVVEAPDVVNLHDVIEFIKKELISEEGLKEIFLYQKISNLAKERIYLISELNKINNEIDNIRRDINDANLEAESQT